MKKTELNNEKGMNVFLVSHDLHVSGYAHRLRLACGKIDWGSSNVL